MKFLGVFLLCFAILGFTGLANAKPNTANTTKTYAVYCANGKTVVNTHGLKQVQKTFGKKTYELQKFSTKKAALDFVKQSNNICTKK